MLEHDTIRLMKDQDLRLYTVYRNRKMRRKLKKLQSSLHYIEDGNATKRKHTIFVDSKKELEKFDPVQHFDTVPELVDRSFNRPRVETIKQTALAKVGTNKSKSATSATTKIISERELQEQFKQLSKQSKKIARVRNASYRELTERAKRVEAMKKAEAHLVTEKISGFQRTETENTRRGKWNARYL